MHRQAQIVGQSQHATPRDAIQNRTCQRGRIELAAAHDENILPAALTYEPIGIKSDALGKAVIDCFHDDKLRVRYRPPILAAQGKVSGAIRFQRLQTPTVTPRSKA